MCQWVSVRGVAGRGGRRSYLQCTTAGPSRGSASSSRLTSSVKETSDATSAGTPRSGQQGKWK
ncbi:hypothetical protein EYF80_011136 [Liparis tanakae]|uniref:Uncharacterized protein n=1 Tax=Liparis tanakae TaxID=230148 RepID=A0A4Z2IL72_9TELE|nr:hypothetical protein EYF80_011136 [Liparis tanakae]